MMSKKSVWIGGTDHERLGPVWVALSEEGLLALRMRSSESEMRERFGEFDVVVDEDRTRPILSQLVEYLEGKRREFDVAIDWSALSDFQMAALQRVFAIPYGQTRTYQQIADELGQPGAARAVGRANATNPLPLVIPCHRVLATDGGLQGYGGAGGVETKAWLLQLEGSRLL
ncbi:MAG: methylated-DNA--[protein]-cysteine S-methyltransferase [Chloroflexota bacterium]